MITLRLPKTVETIDISMPTFGIGGETRYFSITPKDSYFVLKTKPNSDFSGYEIVSRTNMIPLKNPMGIVLQDYICEVMLNDSKSKVNFSKPVYKDKFIERLPCANIIVSTDGDEYVITIDE